MPFNPSTGIYTPPTGAENAVPGEIIRSALWNTIFTDIAAALTQLGQSQIVQAPTILTSGGTSYDVLTTDTLILVQANTPTITLPDSTTKPSPVTIIGNASGIFATHNSTIDTTSSQTIDGQASGTLVLSANYQSITFVPLAAGGWVAK